MALNVKKKLSAVISVSILPVRPKHIPNRQYIWMILQWILLPATIIIFGSFPGLEAQTRLMFGRYMSFWVTPKYRMYQNTDIQKRA